MLSALAAAPLRKGDVAFVLDAAWWRGWCAYVGLDADKLQRSCDAAAAAPPGDRRASSALRALLGGQAPTPPRAASARRPGEVNNSGLCRSIDRGLWELRPGLGALGAGGGDVVALCRGAWEALTALYGGGPAFQRRCVATEAGETVVDLYPELVRVVVLDARSSRQAAGEESPERRPRGAPPAAEGPDARTLAVMDTRIVLASRHDTEDSLLRMLRDTIADAADGEGDGDGDGDGADAADAAAEEGVGVGVGWGWDGGGGLGVPRAPAVPEAGDGRRAPAAAGAESPGSAPSDPAGRRRSGAAVLPALSPRPAAPRLRLWVARGALPGADGSAPPRPAGDPALVVCDPRGAAGAAAPAVAEWVPFSSGARRLSDLLPAARGAEDAPRLLVELAEGAGGGPGAPRWPRDAFEEAPSFRDFRVGQSLDAMDYRGGWYDASVAAIAALRPPPGRDAWAEEQGPPAPRRRPSLAELSAAPRVGAVGAAGGGAAYFLRVHFRSFADKWDEWYAAESLRLAPHGSHALVLDRGGAARGGGGGAEEDEEGGGEGPRALGGGVKARGSTRGVPFRAGACGLLNLCNTCYINAGLQCLSHTPLLRAYLLSGRYGREVNRGNPLGTSGRIAEEVAQVLRLLWGGAHVCVSPQRLKRVLGRFKPQFSGNEQEDAQEFVAEILDALHEDCNRVLEKPYVQEEEEEEEEGDGDEEGAGAPPAPAADRAGRAWAAHLARNRSVIVDLFQGQLRTRLACGSCARRHVRFEPFMFLSVPIPSVDARPLFLWAMRRGAAAPAARLARVAVLLPPSARASQLRAAVAGALGAPEESLCVAELHGHALGRSFYAGDGEAPHQNVGGMRRRTRGRKRGAPPDADPPAFALARDLLAFELPPPPPPPRRRRRRRFRRRRRRLRGRRRRAAARRAGLPRVVGDGRRLARVLGGALRRARRAAARGARGGVLARRGRGRRVRGGGEGAGRRGRPAARGGAGAARALRPVQLQMGRARRRARVGRRRSGGALLARGADDAALRGARGPRARRRGGAAEAFGLPFLLRVHPELPLAALLREVEAAGRGFVRAGWREDARPGAAARALPFRVVAAAKEGLDVGCAGLCARGACGGCALEELEALWERPVANVLTASTRLRLDWASDEFYDEEVERPEEHASVGEVEAAYEAQRRGVTLASCLDEYTKEEELRDAESVYCGRCKSHEPAVVQTSVMRLPEILVIQIKRFQGTATWREKLNTLVDFPLNGLDMTPWLARRGGGAAPEEGECVVYDLYAVANHFGSLQGGHYTAYARSSPCTGAGVETLSSGLASAAEQWIHFDDEFVHEVPSSRVVSESAYVLFFRRRNLSSANVINLTA